MLIGNDWDDALKTYMDSIGFKNMLNLVYQQYDHNEIYPPKDQIFSALRYTPRSQVKVVILGQDPYINPGQAHGLAFSVNPGVPIPPSLLNVYKELNRDLGCFIPDNGCLIPWAKQGVLLLNSVLTVERGKSNSHKSIGWQGFTDAVIRSLNFVDSSIVFMLWGRYAISKESLINPNKHLILKASHPSPLAGGAFDGCSHFSKCQQFRYDFDPVSIDWQIPNIMEVNKNGPLSGAH